MIGLFSVPKICNIRIIFIVRGKLLCSWTIHVLVSKSTIQMISSRKWYLISKRTTTTKKLTWTCDSFVIAITKRRIWNLLNSKDNNCRQCWQNTTRPRTAMHTSFDEWVWELIINVRCHSNIIVNLNRRKIFNATFQINVQRANGAGFLLFLHHPQVWHRRTQLYIQRFPIAKICTPSAEIKASNCLLHEQFHFISFHFIYSLCRLSWIHGGTLYSSPLFLWMKDL